MSNLILPKRSLILPRRDLIVPNKKRQGGFLLNPHRYNSGGGGGASTYASLVAAAAPVLWWKLEETSGTAAADSGSAGVGGTLVGGATFSTVGIAAASGAAGVGRGADMSVASANHISAAITGGTMNALGGGGATGAWTIVLVVAGGANQCYLASRTNDFAVIHNFVSGKVEFFATGMTGSDPRPGSQMDLSSTDTTTPHQVVYRYNNGNWCGLIDGVEIFNVTRSFGLATAITTFYLANSGASNFADRKFWDFQAYARAVSTTDLLAMWNARNNT